MPPAHHMQSPVEAFQKPIQSKENVDNAKRSPSVPPSASRILQPPKPWVPNRFLNKPFLNYQVEELVANTRSGMTFKAHHRELERTVALKVFRPDIFSDSTNRSRFLRAVRTMLEVRIRGVVQLIDAGELHGTCYTVSEFISGESAADLIKRIGIAGMLDRRKTLKIAIDLSEALSELHQRGILHRNIKPEHILIGRDNDKAILSDVILAKAWNDSQCEQLTQQGECLGNLAWQSPEMLSSGQPIDHRSDLYQLGT
ncbi:MAG TPA: hypothetical protein DD473_14495, partial [Planctomycetaceae bacterium]|nr:hypothetical protein [Planctomycetaceae bacterium]